MRTKRRTKKKKKKKEEKKKDKKKSKHDKKRHADDDCKSSDETKVFDGTADAFMGQSALTDASRKCRMLKLNYINSKLDTFDVCRCRR